MMTETVVHGDSTTISVMDPKRERFIKAIALAIRILHRDGILPLQGEAYTADELQQLWDCYREIHPEGLAALYNVVAGDMTTQYEIMPGVVVEMKISDVQLIKKNEDVFKRACAKMRDAFTAPPIQAKDYTARTPPPPVQKPAAMACYGCEKTVNADRRDLTGRGPFCQSCWEFLPEEFKEDDIAAHNTI